MTQVNYILNPDRTVSFSVCRLSAQIDVPTHSQPRNHHLLPSSSSSSAEPRSPPFVWSAPPTRLRTLWSSSGAGSSPVVTLHVSSLIPVSAGSRPIPSEEAPKPSPRSPYNIPLLKSSLQKCVRRGLSRLAVKTAHTLFHLDPLSLLRRVIVICIEDALLHPGIAQIVWLMCACGKGYRMSADDRNAVLRFVGDIAAVGWKDTSVDATAEFRNPLVTNSCEEFQLRPLAESIVAGLILRANYGGMKGDIGMLKSYAMLWWRRFRTAPDVWWKTIIQCYKAEGQPDWIPFHPISMREGEGDDVSVGVPRSEIRQLAWKCPGPYLSRPTFLQKQDRPCFAVDFHMFPWLLKKTIAFLEDRQVSEQDLRTAIWFHSSGVSVKARICASESEMVPSFPRGRSPAIVKMEHESRALWERIRSFWISETSRDFYWRMNTSPKKTTGKKRSRKRGDAAAADDSDAQPARKRRRKKATTPPSKKITSFFRKKKSRKRSSVASSLSSPRAGEDNLEVILILDSSDEEIE